MRTAIVVGAGVGGLAAAGALARTGWRVTLLERSDRLRGSGAALLIWPNGAAALQGAVACLYSLSSILGPPLMTQVFARFSSPTARLHFPGAPFLASAVLTVACAALFVHALHMSPLPAAGGRRTARRFGDGERSATAGRTARRSSSKCAGSADGGSHRKPRSPGTRSG